MGTKIDASRVDIGEASLFRLICTAYRLRPYQLSGPAWLRTTMYDVQAKLPAGVAADKLPEMLRTLLTERFALKTHRETKDQPVYALVVEPGGIKMKASAPEPPPPALPPGAPKPVETSLLSLEGNVKIVRTAQGATVEMPDGEISGKLRVTPVGGAAQATRLHLESSGTTMKSFAAMLSVGVVDRPVVDKTGLTGAYEVALDISFEDMWNAAGRAMNARPGGPVGAGAPAPPDSIIFQSIGNLGLKLEPRKLPLELLVVDRAEKTPTAN